MAFAEALVKRCDERGFEKTAMATVREASVLCRDQSACAKSRDAVVACRY
jgi:hypothetical protein